MKNKFKETFPYILVYLIIFILLFLQHNVVHMYYDDFGNASLSYATTVENVIKTNYSFSQLLDEAVFTYFNFGGRVLYGMIATLLLKHGIKPFMITQIFVVLGIIYMISSIVTKITKKKSFIYPIICMILYMLFDISIANNGIYWASASILYLWPLLPFFTLVNYYMKSIELIKQNKEVNYFKYIIINILLIIFTVFSQEQIGVGLISFFFVYIFFDHMKSEKKYLKYDLFTVIFSIIIYLCLFLAPGNYARMDMNNSEFANFTFFQKIRYNYPRIVHNLFKFKPNTYMLILGSVLLIFLGYYFIKNYKKSKKYFLLLIPIGGLIVNYILYDKQYYSNSKLLTIVGTGILASMFIALIIYYFDKKKPSYLAFPISAAASVFCLLMSPVVNNRTCIPCILILFISIISIGYELFNSNKTLKTLVIILTCICSYYGLDNYRHVYMGYKNNYGTMEDNYNKLAHYEKYSKNDKIKLCKVKDILYGSEQPYITNYDKWLQEYFELPRDLEMEWNDCNGKN